MKKKDFERVYIRVRKIRDFLISEGAIFFGLLGFAYSSFIMSYLFVVSKVEAPKVFMLSIYAFQLWIIIIVLLIFISAGLKAILKNKKNFQNGKR